MRPRKNTVTSPSAGVSATRVVDHTDRYLIGRLIRLSVVVVKIFLCCHPRVQIHDIDVVGNPRKLQIEIGAIKGVDVRFRNNQLELQPLARPLLLSLCGGPMSVSGQP